jgi:nitrite reductase (NADH) small subunit
MSSGIDIGAVSDFPDQQLTKVEIGGTEMGVCRWGDEVFVFRNRCPHEGAPLCSGFLQKKLSATLIEDEPELEVDEQSPVILCPWHRWEFDLRTGKAAWPGFRMRTYRTTVDDGRVIVSIGRKGSDGHG